MGRRSHRVAVSTVVGGSFGPRRARSGRTRLDGAKPSRGDGDWRSGLFAHQNGNPLPGVCPVAIQQGRHAARNILRALQGLPTEVFHYRDKGNLATIGRAQAVADFGRFKSQGSWRGWPGYLFTCFS